MYPTPDPKLPVLTQVEEEENESGKPSAINPTPDQAITLRKFILST
jgi:hypothetical protein